ncbi:hypothetical protein [Pseudomonas silesiensis]
MSDYSLAELTSRMQGKSVTLGWDAVVFMNRAKVNSLLEQQYITRFNNVSFLKQIFGSPAMTPGGAEVLELGGLILSHPRLSFEQASLRDSRVTATMDIVAGTVSYVRKATLQTPEVILYSYVVSAHQGYTVTMDIDLAASKGTVSERGKVTIDIGDGYNCRCNLVTNDQSQEMLGNFFKALFLEQKPEDRVYTLGKLDLRDVDLLAPRSFMIRTMATDEGKLRTSDNFGDGAVVLLVRAKGNPDEGDDPAEGAFDYLIPNDRDAQGNAMYSGALVLASRVVFDWYIQSAIETVVSHDLRLDRIPESNDIARSLQAIAGEINFPGFQLVWNEDFLHDETLASKGPLSIGFHQALTDRTLQVSSDQSQLLFRWDPDIKFPLNYYENNPTPVPDKDIDFYPYINIFIQFVMRPVLERGSNNVTFVRQPGEIFDHEYRFSQDESGKTLFPMAAKERIWLNDHFKLSVVDKLNAWKSLEIPEVNVLAISNLLFPERNALQLTQARLPGDLALFGHIDPKETTFTLDPLLPVIKAGEQQHFSIRQLGIKAAQVTWSVRSVDGARASGTIDNNGQYTAPDVQLLEGTAARNVVTATYTDPVTENEVTASALVTVVLAGVVVTPSMAQIVMRGSEDKTVTLRATTLGGGTLKWTLRGNQGSLSATEGEEVIYTGPQTPPAGSLESVLIDVEDTVTGDKAIATVLLLNGTFSLVVTPAFHPGLRANGHALLQGPPDLPVKWSLVAGEGLVDPDSGAFTAPSVISQPYSVVKGTVGGISGYSIIHLSDHARQSNWFGTDLFDFVVDSAPTRVWANGLQQAKVTVRFRAATYDGAPDPLELSPDEYDSIMLVSANDHVALSPVGTDGVPQGRKWHYNENENDYDKYPASVIASQPAVSSPTREAKRYTKEFFVQCHKVENLLVAATIRNDNNQRFYSNPGDDDDEQSKKVLNLIAVQPPEGGTGGQTLFELTGPTRVFPDGADSGDDYTLESIDYYYLKLLIKGTKVDIKKIEFVGNSSMLKWESNTHLEDVYSITGHAFRHAPDPEDPDDKGDPDAKLLRIDPILLRRLNNPPDSLVLPSAPVPKGEALFSLHRCQYWRYDKYAKSDFDSTLELIIHDAYGNRHGVTIGFDGNNRNKLKIVGT